MHGHRQCAPGRRKARWVCVPMVAVGVPLHGRIAHKGCTERHLAIWLPIHFVLRLLSWLAFRSGIYPNSRRCSRQTGVGLLA